MRVLGQAVTYGVEQHGMAQAPRGSMSRRDVMKGGAAITTGAVTSSVLAGCSGAVTPPAPAPRAGVTFVVAHGAWSSGWAWKKMHPLMTARGHRLITPSYTGLGERVHLANANVDLDTHITDIVNVLFYEDLRDIVLVGHSYGGMVATGVADRARDRIRQLIYLDAFVPADGQSLFDLTGQGSQPRETAVDGWRVPPNPPPPDTAAEDLPWIAARRLHQPIRTLEQPLKLTQGPLTVPRHYVRCTKSETFRTYADKARAAGWPVDELDSSHNPHITVPEALADLLERITLKTA
jgi:pimeloyl-ACP methyl ester carboxylesterase